MKRKAGRKPSLYMRLVLTYSLIIVVLVLVIVSVYVAMFYQNLRTEGRRQNEAALSQFAASAERHVFEFTEQFTTGFLANNDPEIAAFLSKPTKDLTMYQILVVHGNLKSYLLTNSLYHSIYLYRPDAALVVSTTGSYFLDIDSPDRRDVNWLVQSSFPGRRHWMVMKGFLPHYNLDVSNERDVLSMVRKYPFVSGDSSYKALIAVNLSAEMFYQAVKVESANESDLMVLMGPDGEFLPNPAYSSLLDAQSYATLQVIYENKEQEAILQIGEETYSILYEESPSGFAYFHLDPHSLYTNQLRPVINIAIIIAIIAIAGPVIISMLLTQRIYMPIRQLTKRSIEVSKELGQETEEKAHESAIFGALDLLSERVHSLQNEIAAFAPERKNALMRMIFGMEGASPGHIETELNLLGISFPYPHYACLFLTFSGQKAIDPAICHTMYYNICYFSENMHMDGAVRLATGSIGEGVSILINYDAPDAPERFLQALRSFIDAQYIYQPIFGLSSPTDLLDQVPGHYACAQRAPEYRFLLPDQDVFTQQELLGWESNRAVTPVALHTKLERGLKAADLTSAKQALEEVFVQLTDAIYEIGSVRGEIRMLGTMLEEKMAAIDPDGAPAVPKSKPYDIAQAKAQLLNNCEAYCLSRQSQMSNRLSDDIERIQRYIVERVEAFDIDSLSLSQVARRFDKNPNYLSSLFPEYAGMNFKDFVTNTKLEKAASELAKPGAVIYNVANQLGYYNVSYFIRVFKAKYGCTPGQYYDHISQKSKPESEQEEP